MPYKNKEDQLAYQRRWMRERRARFTDGQKCAHCGSTEKIHWHHVDPAQKISHRIWTWAIPRIQAELAKCIPLCSGCHAIHHKGGQLVHGTKSGYSNYGCRCRQCLDAANAYNRGLRARQRAAAAS